MFESKDAFLKVKIDPDGNITLPWDWLCEMGEDSEAGLDFIEEEDDNVVIRKYDTNVKDSEIWT